MAVAVDVAVAMTKRADAAIAVIAEAGKVVKAVSTVVVAVAAAVAAVVVDDVNCLTNRSCTEQKQRTLCVGADPDAQDKEVILC